MFVFVGKHFYFSVHLNTNGAKVLVSDIVLTDLALSNAETQEMAIVGV